MNRREITAIVAFMVVCCSAGTAVAQSWTEVSAPIFPQVLVLYAGEGANFPADVDGEVQLVMDASMTYDFLLNQCAAEYPAITVAGPGLELTNEQLMANYNEVARCSYEKFTSKPYWIPQLVDDVDVCGMVLGDGWHLPSQAEVESLSDADRTFLATTMTETAGGQFWGGFYFSLNVFVRADDGTLKQASLLPGVSQYVAPLGNPYEGYDPKRHLESVNGVSTVIRCFRNSI